MDILAGLRIAIDTFYYNLILSIAGLHWSLLRGFILMGYAIELLNEWLATQAFAPLIQQTNDSLSVAVSFAFFIALLILGITYMLSSLIRLEVVDLRSAIQWYIAGALFFSLGPSLYLGMNDFRASIAQGFYASALSGLQGAAGSSFHSLGQVESNDLALGPLCDYLGAYLPAGSAGTVDGLDVALAYLRADGPDVMGYPAPVYSPGCPAHLFHPLTGDYISGVPQDWFFDGSYFDFPTSSVYFEGMSDSERAASIATASSAHGRMLTAWPLVIFGVAEQLVYLLITIAMGLTFLSFGMAVLFAFFKKTEVIARSIVDQWIELIVQTVVIAMVQSLVVAFFLVGTASGNGMVVLGIGLICLIFMLIVLWSGVKAVWNSLNRLFNAMGQATGGVMMTPGVATVAATGAGALAVGSAVSVGASALAGMSALNSGATMAQAAGVAVGGSRTLSGAARTLAYLPGLRNTSLGEAAEQFTEGSITRQVAGNIPVIGAAAGPILGAKLLTNRDPDAAQYDDEGRLLGRPMLVPAVGEGLEAWTLPRGAQRRNRTAEAPEYMEGENGEMLPVAPAPRRMGTFTPVAPVQDSSEDNRRQQRSAYAAEMQGEEMEQHLTDTLRSSTGVTSPLGAMMEDKNEGDASRLGQAAARIEASADLLARAAQMQMMVGQLRVSGVPDVAGVMGDVVGKAQQDSANNLNTLEVGQRMAQVMGVRPQSEAPIQQDLARFGLFANQALKLGLSPQQTEQVVREVQTSPDGKLQPQTREMLDKQVEQTNNMPWLKARGEVDKLEHSARMLPPEITAYGAMQIPNVPDINVQVDPTIHVNLPKEDSYDEAMKQESALGGSGDIIGGGA